MLYKLSFIVLLHRFSAFYFILQIFQINGQKTTSKETAPGIMVPRAIMLQYGKKGDVIVFKMLLQKLQNKSSPGVK